MKLNPIPQPKVIDENGHININPIVDIAKKLDCPYIAFIGSKRIGKTYGCISYALRDFYESGHSAFYTRRYDKTFTESICGNLVRVHRQDIINLSKTQHNTGELYGKYFDLMRIEKTASGETRRRNRQHFMYCRSLNNIETETADDKEDISCVIYDEFLTRGCELKDEFNKLMILHANATGKRTDRFIPMFLLGNTVNRESVVAECFGVDLRKLKRGLNIISNNNGVVRIVVYYAPETSKDTSAANKYYDRFQNDHINMISHGDWTLGTYRIATQHELSLTGTDILISHKSIAVTMTITADGMQPRVIISSPRDNYDLRITSNLSKTAINFIPPQIVKLILGGYLVAETPEIGEDFRDICKHINGGDTIVKFIE